MRKLHKTFKNKSYSLTIISVGVASIFINMDATVFLLALMMGVPLFFAKENVID